MLRYFPSKAAIYTALTAVVAGFMAWLRIDARRDQNRKNELEATQNRMKAMKHKQEIEDDVEKQDDTSLIDRLTND